MTFQYLDEMRLTSQFLDAFRLRLSDKLHPVLPPQGMLYERVEPNSKSLVGCLGAAPNPDFQGPQPPNALGMVLLVTPDENGEVRVTLSGQFDLSHRYIPEVTTMREDLVMDQYEGQEQPRRSQLISLAFRKYTVLFEDIDMILDTRTPNAWVGGAPLLEPVLEAHRMLLGQDQRVMRRCRQHDSGGAVFNFNWHEHLLDSQQTLNDAVYTQIIAQPNELLQYQVALRGRLRPAPAALLAGDQRSYLLEIYLENQTRTEDAKAFGVEFPYLLDAQLRATLCAGTAHSVPHRLKPEDYRYQADDGLPGYGITCAVDSEDGRLFVTNTLPTTAQPRIHAPTPEQMGMRHPPHYLALSKAPLPVLDDFVEALGRYEAQWDACLATLEAQGATDALNVARREREDFHRERARVQDGIDLLRREPELLKAFCWMNEAMNRAIQLQGKPFLGWHLFQLGFILTQVRAVYERLASETQQTGALEIAEVLWFATGGGKTEAYLGIISLMMLYSRLKGRSYGTTAWMRFPLRMLSVQQFQRLSYVLAQSNCIREREGLGGWPFTIGYYTGSGTPARITSTYGEDRTHGFLATLSPQALAAYQFISDCPYCGQVGSIHMTTDYNRGRIRHICRNADCWSNAQASPGTHGEGIRGEIGIYVSDEECYRYLPTVLVGTVDKLAVIGHNARFANFFGTAGFFCPEHGFSRESVCEHRRIVGQGTSAAPRPCGNNTRTSVLKVIKVPPLKDPGLQLLVQDELHLLSESLGNFSGHYESLLDALQRHHGGRSPKRLAATATIKDFEAHVHHLYLRQAVRFPCPGVTQGESFYARKTVDPATGTPLVRRWFAGILPIGRGRIAMQAVAEASQRFLDQVDDWRVALRQRDPAFLAGLGLLASQAPEALRHLEKHLNTNLIYANSKRNITEVQRFIEESQRPDRQRLYRVLDGLTTLDAILDAIRHVENKQPDDTTRTLIATSVVSHGVDIAELNFMVMAGWPKSTAEYIQASARSGRVHPGIVVCVLSSKQLFETNVFLNFTDYHQFLDKLVDSVPINRFAPNVLGRTLPGILQAVLLNWAPQQSWGQKLGRNVAPLVVLLQTGKSGGIREAIEQVALDALRVPQAIASKFDARVLSEFQAALRGQVSHALWQLEHWPGSKHDQSLSDALGDIFGFKPFRSFRDIEPEVPLIPQGRDADDVIMALAR